MKEYRLHLYRLLSILLPEMSCNSIKREMLRWCGATVGKNCRICSSALISGSGNLTIGDEVYIGSKVVIRAAEGSSIHIGNYCDIAVNSCLWSATHSILSINADQTHCRSGNWQRHQNRRWLLVVCRLHYCCGN